ncbi:tyrosine-type recombinase/integrase [Kutzneria buriramensis]|uniref:Site-specific recombinase XerD n=1 Tax=Kutzneria buriramensis TaxID=1045776 RepID=A0A3E0GXK7_9PSEU|nr:tyrosine-type recombinase/integrase [Kutzneria buriramensis]REH31003.1 site-specific recombinase XerD [Kutzneria buriramensis]
MTSTTFRDLTAIQLPKWGAVRAASGPVPWLLVDDDGQAVLPVHRYFIDFVARDTRLGSVRSYAYDLLRWWRWLIVVDVAWDKATSAEVRDFVLWMKQARKVRRHARTVSAATAGTLNPVTGKQYLDDQYKPRSIAHSNAVLRAFYEFWVHEDGTPLVNPVPLDRSGHRRPHAHHNPLQPYRAGEGRLRYNPKIPKRRPREMPEDRWKDFFGALRFNRDRAITATAVSNGARAAELLGVRGVDLDWGEQMVRVFRKGTGAEQWLPVSSEALVWTRLYLAELPPLDPQEQVWRTLRRRDYGAGLEFQPLNYEALRAVLRRINTLLGTNWSMHDLRHTAALRMARDERLSLRDVQEILGHAHLATTGDTYLIEQQAEVVRRVQCHLADRAEQAQRPAAPSAGYASTDLDVLFGGGAE